MTALALRTSPSKFSSITNGGGMIDIGRDFSETPGGRYIRHGAFSGEEFRKNILVPRFREALARGDHLRVRIDGVKRSYQSSFLDEAFAGLIREEGFRKQDLYDHLIIVCDAPRFLKYKDLAETYIDKA